MDDAHLRVLVALAFIGVEELAEGCVVGGGGANAFGAAETGFDGAFILADGVDAEDEDAHDEPERDAEEESGKQFHLALQYSVFGRGGIYRKPRMSAVAKRPRRRPVRGRGHSVAWVEGREPGSRISRRGPNWRLRSMASTLAAASFSFIAA